MISKKKLKERLLDLANGAGMEWMEEGQYFEDACLENVGNLIIAIERAFALPKNTRLRLPFSLKEYDDIDTLTGFVHEAIEYDADGLNG
ncbi:MAG: hypothetical protein COB23_02995 [Methylophaga sp.]|nr:MAG: hypothetical protein COB23_02995 [Methylophaga sp.]